MCGDLMIGLQIFRNDGSLSLNLTNRIIKPLGEFYAQLGDQQYIVDDRIVGKNIAIFYVSATIIKTGTHQANIFPNNIYIKSNKICWEFLGNANIDSKAHIPESYTVYRCKFSYGWY